jgi:hypothetical protein
MRSHCGWENHISLAIRFLSVFYVYFLLVCVDAELHRRAAGSMRAYIRRGAVVIVIEIRNYYTRILFLQVPETKTLIT